MIKHRLVAAAITAAVVVTVVFELFVPSDVQRETALIRRFPQLITRQRRVAPRVADPLLRTKSENGAQEKAYDDALDALLQAQKRLSAVVKWKAIAADARLEVNRREATARALRTAGWDDVKIERQTILVMFRNDATPEQIEDVLTRYRLQVLSGIPRLTLFVVNVADGNGDASPEEESTSLRARIEQLNREPNVESAVENVPLYGATVPPANNPPSGRDWFRPTDPLVISHFPQAWNFQQAVAHRPRPPHITVGVLDEGFSSSIPADLDMPPSSPPCGMAVNDHGTQVAGIIGAKFGNGTGSDGAAPNVTIVGCAPPTPGFDKSLISLETLAQVPTLRLINASVSYRWGPSLTPTKKLVAENQGKILRKALKDFPDTVVVSAAGNDCRTGGVNCPATWASPFNWAALGPASEFPQSPNVIVVEALGLNEMPLPDTNDGNMIAAVGEGLLTFDQSNAVDFMTASTSAATPVVTSAIALMLQVSPNISVDDIKRNLDLGAGHHLNAFNAVRSSSPTADIDLADLNSDGQVDMQDFEIFRRQFREIRNNNFTEDLNGDGLRDTNDRRFCRIDLDGNGIVEPADLDVMIRARTDHNVDPTNLKNNL